jgi:hypothetical protein
MAGVSLLTTSYMLVCFVFITWALFAWVNGLGFPNDYFLVKLCSRQHNLHVPSLLSSFHALVRTKTVFY